MWLALKQGASAEEQAKINYRSEMNSKLSKFSQSKSQL